MGRVAELRRTVQRRTGNLYDTVFTRRVSVYVTAALAPLPVRANHVSAVNVLVGVAACALVAFGGRPAIVGGVLLLHLYAVLDSVDGELARLRKDYSLAGLFLEDWSAYTMINGVNLSVAWYLQRCGWGAWPLVAAVMLAAFGRNVMPVARRALIKSVLTRRPPALLEAGASSPAPRESPLVRWGRFVSESLLHCTNTWLVLSSLLVIEVVAGRSLGLVLAAFWFYNALHVAREAAALVRCVVADALERQLGQLYAAAAVPPGACQADPRRLSEFEPCL